MLLRSETTFFHQKVRRSSWSFPVFCRQRLDNGRLHWTATSAPFLSFFTRFPDPLIRFPFSTQSSNGAVTNRGFSTQNNSPVDLPQTSQTEHCWSELWTIGTFGNQLGTQNPCVLRFRCLTRGGISWVLTCLAPIVGLPIWTFCLWCTSLKWKGAISKYPIYMGGTKQIALMCLLDF